MKHLVTILLTVILATVAEAKPLKVLLVTGGCCHDYVHQKEVLKAGLEARVDCQVDIVFVPDSSTKPNLPIYGNPKYADGYDVVIHDECAADISDEAVVRGVLKPHDDGIPGVNLHCGMHSYRIGNPNDPVKDIAAPHALWFNYLGLQSSGHGPQLPISIHFLCETNPITAGMADWTTIKEEHYNNIKLYDGITPLARGTQVMSQNKTNDFIVAWTNLYKNKTRVFSTTIGHNTETVAEPRYLDLVAKGLAWAAKRNDALKTPSSALRAN